MNLDLGCGPYKRTDAEWVSVDKIKFDGVDIVSDAIDYLKSLPNDSIDNINASHFIEHLKSNERIELFNEIYRILIPGGRVFIECPDWTCASAYGDPTHKFPPISEWTFSYLNKNWRDTCAPHCGYTCNFNAIVTKEKNTIIIIKAILLKI